MEDEAWSEATRLAASPVAWRMAPRARKVRRARQEVERALATGGESALDAALARAARAPGSAAGADRLRALVRKAEQRRAWARAGARLASTAAAPPVRTAADDDALLAELLREAELLRASGASGADVDTVLAEAHAHAERLRAATVVVEMPDGHCLGVQQCE